MVTAIQLVGWRSALWRLIEGLMLAGGAVGLFVLCDETFKLLAAQDLPSNLRIPYWVVGVFASSAILVALGAFIVLIEAVRWLAAVAAHGEFVVIWSRTLNGIHSLKIILKSDAGHVFSTAWWNALNGGSNRATNESCEKQINKP